MPMSRLPYRWNTWNGHGARLLPSVRDTVNYVFTKIATLMVILAWQARVVA